MASKQSYECFVCKNNGFPAVMVYLAGKDDQGRAIRQEADGSPHQHKTKVPSQQQSQQPLQQPTIADLMVQVKLLQQKMGSVLELLKKEHVSEEGNGTLLDNR